MVHQDNGVDSWLFQGMEIGEPGLGAVASWPKDEWGFDPVGFAEMRPGCYDIHDRVRDMNVNGVLGVDVLPNLCRVRGHAGWPKPRTGS